MSGRDVRGLPTDAGQRPARWPDLVWSALLLVVGSLSLAAAWEQWPPVLLLALAAVLPLVLLQVAVALGVGRWAAVSVLVALLVLAAWTLAAEAGSSLPTTVRDAVPRLLTTPQPYPVRADLLVGPLLLTGLASLLVGLRAGSGRRVTPVTTAAGLYTAGLLLTSGRADPWGFVAALLAAASIAGWVLLDGQQGAARAQVRGLAPLLSVVVVGVAVAAGVPATDAFEPRRLVDPPAVEVVTSSPMPRLGAWAADPERELLRVRGPAVPLRLVTLDTYDGDAWSAASRYAAFGTGPLEPPLPPGREQRAFTHRVEVTGLGGHWLPSAGHPRHVSDDAVRVDPRTGTLFHTVGATGLTYEVGAVLDTPADELLPAARVPTGADDREAVHQHLSLPPLPAGLAAAAEEATRDAVTPYERAMAVEEHVRSAARLSSRAISGSQLWRLETFLDPDADQPGAGIGTSEQFAGAFAVLARANGLPTRVVVGFRPGRAEPAGDRVVRGRDAFAWPEVYFRDLGWVPFSPTPDDDTFRRDPVDGPVAPGGEDEPVPQPTATASPGEDEAADPVPVPPADEDARPTRHWVAFVGVLPVLVLALLAAARLVRRRRHLARGAPGAWREVVDALHLTGHRPPAHRTATEVARLADVRWGTTAAEPLARLAEEAAFGPVGSRAGGADPEVRALLREIRRAARRVLPWWRRWWWSLDPRVLLRR